MSQSLADRALVILHEWVKSDSLRKHCYAVGASMKYFAGKTPGVDSDLWMAVGLLHDMDYEKHPSMEEGHPFVAARWLKEQGWGDEVCRAVLSHADYAKVERQTALEKTLYAVDELSGLITAVALVRPSKNIADVQVSSVKKKMKDKAFARAVDRTHIVQGAAELPLPLDELIADIIEALKADASRLGIDGSAA